MKKIILLLLFLPFIGFAQNDSINTIEKKELLTDTTIVYGKVIKESFVGDNISQYCLDGSDKIIEEGEILVISGALECKSTYPDKVTQFYEILYKNKNYFIKKENVFTINDNFIQILNFDNEQKVKFKETASRHSDILRSVKIEKALTFLNSCKSKGLAILNWSFYDESEYTEGTSAKIEVYNPTNKTIKYLWFSFIGYNAVDDIVVSNKTGLKTITTKGVGPIKPSENASYDYKYVWFTDLIETAKISQIKVQYMDGSFKTILNPREITLSAEYNDILNDE